MQFQSSKIQSMNFMTKVNTIGFLIIILISACTSQKKLAYLNNLPQPDGEEKFTLSAPDYKIQNRDVLYITLKAMNPEGQIVDFLSGNGVSGGVSYMQGDAGGFLYGYDVKPDGTVVLPVVGIISVEGKTLEETRKILQEEFSKHYKNAILECKLLSFKFTVIGEVKAPGTYVNYNNYLTVLEAIGRAGGMGDLGNRDRILVVRPIDKGTKTFRLNLQDKNILSSEAYFLLPNDVVIIEPVKQKIFNMNLPTISFVISTFTASITMTLLLINYLK
jgi:polysaccharide export outer membrane protein